MANIYLRSTTGSDSNGGTSWADAKATLAGALAVASAGDTVWVSQSHAGSSAGGVINFPGTLGNRVRVLCGNDAAEPPTALATTATIQYTSNVNFTGFADIYGIAFDVTVSTTLTFGNGSNDFRFNLDNVKLALGNGSAGRMYFGGNSASGVSQRVVANSVTFKFGNTAQGIIVRGASLILKGCSVDAAGSVPATALFLNLAGSVYGQVEVFNSDLSTITTALVGVGNGKSSYVFRNSRLNAGVTPVTGTIGDESIALLNCDSGGTNYLNRLYVSEGTKTTETTLVKTGGASNGTTPISWKFVTSSVPSFYSPLRSEPIALWNETTGSSVTVTVDVLHDSATALKDDEIWLEVEYLGTSSYPLGSLARDRKTDILATGANQTTSSATWTTTGMSNPNTQQVDISFTPQMKGLFVVRVAIAKPSYTVYVDPVAQISGFTSARQYLGPYSVYVNEGPATITGGSGGGSFVVVQ